MSKRAEREAVIAEMQAVLDKMRTLEIGYQVSWKFCPNDRMNGEKAERETVGGECYVPDSLTVWYPNFTNRYFPKRNEEATEV